MAFGTYSSSAHPCGYNFFKEFACPNSYDQCASNDDLDDAARGGKATYCKEGLYGQRACGAASDFCKRWGMDDPYCSK